jgi:metal-responsive CopG/Arc/MetJ family transcriptional regulator
LLLLNGYKIEKFKKEYFILWNTMKQKLSITIEEDLANNLEILLDTGRFRNKSHIVEFALNKLIQKENEKE